MFLEINEICDVLTANLENAGFVPFSEFTAVDSLIYSNSPIGFYSLKSSQMVGAAYESLTDCVGEEYQLDFEIKLMGKSCEFMDYEDFENRCRKFFCSISEDGRLLIKTVKFAKAYQSSPLKRLTRDLTVTVIACVTEDEE